MDNPNDDDDVDDADVDDDGDDLIESIKVFCRLTVKVEPPDTGKQLLGIIIGS